jgi:hypothetical protein
LRTIGKYFTLKNIIIFGFIVRVLYLCFGARLYSAETSIFTNNDSFSYSDGFINLWKHGIYTFDLSEPDAAFGRLPVYPFFWWIHYIIFSKFAYQAVAITQLLLDTLAIYFIFKITLYVFKCMHTALIAAFLYASFFFIILWIPITGTESFATFVTIYFFYFLFCKQQTKFYFLKLGLLLALLFYSREYLIILLPVSAFYLWRNNYSLKNIFVSCIIFTALYALWPIRNYINYNKVVWVKTKTAGYKCIGEDYIAFRSWCSNWCSAVDFNEIYFNKLIHSKDSITFPAYCYSNPQEKQMLDELVTQLRNCGSGIQQFEHIANIDTNNCNTTIVNNFN